MSSLRFQDIVSTIPQLDVTELVTLKTAIEVAIGIRTQTELSTDSPELKLQDDEGPDLNDQAQAILEDPETFSISLADQALLASLVLSEGYHQDAFSSRDVNNIIEESGRPRVAHITSAISGLLDRTYLTGSTKSLSLSREGRAKARALIGMIRRKAAAV